MTVHFHPSEQGWVGGGQTKIMVVTRKTEFFKTRDPFVLQTRSQSPFGGEKTFSTSFVPQPAENNTSHFYMPPLAPQ